MNHELMGNVTVWRQCVSTNIQNDISEIVQLKKVAGGQKMTLCMCVTSDGSFIITQFSSFQFFI